MTDLTLPIFTDETAAREHLEMIRWNGKPFCPHCGEAEQVTKMQGESHRAGLHQCNSCRGAFTVTNGTVMESSHIPLNKWVLAFHLMCASKKGMSALQIQRMLSLGSYRTAWFMVHRIREAMRSGGMAPPMGGKGKVVEIDETYIGKKKGVKVKTGAGHKHAVLTLVERDGESRSFHVDGTSHLDVMPIIRANIDRETRVVTDEANIYRHLGNVFKSHSTVNHGQKEYVRGNVHTNTVEGFYSVFKRGMKGVYQHCGEQHLHRYVAEFDFRYSNRAALGVNDEARTFKAIRGAEGKRLTLQAPQARKTLN